ncbi:MAG: hypothetical protein M9933_11970 [Chitinophagaceae bacterium]|nr:hypothetical protein [Chitinophagaceae bacterium]
MADPVIHTLLKYAQDEQADYRWYVNSGYLYMNSSFAVEFVQAVVPVQGYRHVADRIHSVCCWSNSAYRLPLFAYKYRSLTHISAHCFLQAV